MYKKNKIIELKIEAMAFPNNGVGYYDGGAVYVKGSLIGQKITCRMKKRRNDIIIAELCEITERAEYEISSECPHFGACGGCSFQTMPYEAQLKMKESMVLSLFRDNGIEYGEYEGISKSPEPFQYRNKMEFSFGDTGKDGELSLGLRKKSSYYEVVHVKDCVIIDNDYRKILNAALDYFKATGLKYYSSRKNEGILRHLVVRKSKSAANGDILVNLVTTSEIDEGIVCGFSKMLAEIETDGRICGILHTKNDSPADAVKLDNVEIISGTDYFYDSVCGLNFKITKGSFFQTNTLGAEVLYGKVLELASKSKISLAYDLYCGTGTITQIISKIAERAVGVEIVNEAIDDARQNAKENGIENVTFICGDVLKAMDELTERPQLILLDPPREGIHPKAIGKIIGLAAERIIYISCKPTSLVRDLKLFIENGYTILNTAIVDMFPFCAHVECVVLMSKKDA